MDKKEVLRFWRETMEAEGPLYDDGGTLMIGDMVDFVTKGGKTFYNAKVTGLKLQLEDDLRWAALCDVHGVNVQIDLDECNIVRRAGESVFDKEGVILKEGDMVWCPSRCTKWPVPWNHRLYVDEVCKDRVVMVHDDSGHKLEAPPDLLVHGCPPMCLDGRVVADGQKVRCMATGHQFVAEKILDDGTAKFMDVATGDHVEMPTMNMMHDDWWHKCRDRSLYPHVPNKVLACDSVQQLTDGSTASVQSIYERYGWHYLSVSTISGYHDARIQSNIRRLVNNWKDSDESTDNELLWWIDKNDCAMLTLTDLLRFVWRMSTKDHVLYALPPVPKENGND